MKAKEYIKIYEKNKENMDIKKAIEKILWMYIEEGQEMIKKRNIKLDNGLISIIKELNQKWNAMMKYSNDIKKDGYLNAILIIMPNIKIYF